MKKLLRILIIEDSEDDVLLVVHQIKNGGYDIEYERVETAETMRAALSEKPWDIVLSDYRMPHFNGLDALVVLKESDLDIPFIIISGVIVDKIAVEAMKAGARDYVMKNNMYRLLPAIERELRESKNRAEQKFLEQKLIKAETLRVSEEQHRLLFETSKEGIAIAQEEKLCYFNSMMLNITGYSADELLHMNFLNLFSPADKDKVLTNYRKRILGENAEQRYQVRIVKKDETIRWVELSAVKFNWNGQPASLAYLNDITEQKQSEDTLKSALERSYQQQAVITNIAVSPQFAEGDVQGLAYQITEQAAKAVDVERVSVWLFKDEGNGLVCVDLYEHSADRHSAGAVLLKNEYKNEFEALQTAKYIDANDPLTDPRTAGYVEGYLKPLHITSMLDAVIREGSRNIGVLCFEHVEKKHNWEPDEIAFASQLADQIALTVLNHERKLVEELLRQSEIKLQVILESTADGILAIDRDGKVIRTNTRFAELWKIPPAVLNSGVDATLLNFVLEQLIDPMQFLNKVQQLYNSKDEDTDTLHFKDGRIFERYSAPLILDDKIIGRVWSFRNITEHKRAEAEINMLAHAIKNSADCIAITNKDYKIIFINDSFSKVYGFEKEEIVGQPISVITSRNNLPEVGQALYSAMEKNEVWTGEVLNIRKDGNDFPVHLSLAPVITDNGELIAIVGVLRDITEDKRAEAEIKLKNEQLLKLNAEKDKFFSIIAHNLRDPFVGFLGLTKILAEELESLTIDEIQEFSVTLKSSATTLSRLLENLLQWSKMQRGSMPYNPELLQLLQVVEECFAIVMASAKNKGIEITSDIQDDLMVFADSNMLQTIIRNMVSNAVKFTPKGGNVCVSAKVTENKSVEISIKDTGIGMTSEMVNNLFRLDVKTNRKGTEGEPSSGLGLLLCKEFIEKLGGKIRVESEEGKGSEFKFTLPIAN